MKNMRSSEEIRNQYNDFVENFSVLISGPQELIAEQVAATAATSLAASLVLETALDCRDLLDELCNLAASLFEQDDNVIVPANEEAVAKELKKKG